MLDEVVVVVEELDGKGLLFSLLWGHKNEVKHGESTNLDMGSKIRTVRLSILNRVLDFGGGEGVMEIGMQADCSLGLRVSCEFSVSEWCYR